MLERLDAEDLSCLSVFEDRQFPFALNLERNWQIIRSEMIALRSSRLMDWPENLSMEKQGVEHIWPFTLLAKNRRETCALCRCALSLIEMVPGLATAGFSRLAAGALHQASRRLR